jgi:hypothetical protein
MEHVCKSYKVTKSIAGMKETCKSIIKILSDSFELLKETYSVPNPIYQNKLEELSKILQLDELSSLGRIAANLYKSLGIV